MMDELVRDMPCILHASPHRPEAGRLLIEARGNHLSSVHRGRGSTMASASAVGAANGATSYAVAGSKDGNGQLRAAQVRSLISLLNFNDPNFSHLGNNRGSADDDTAGSVPKAPPVWKVLIMDPTSTDILSTSLRVQDLRENGVTLHL